MPLTAALKSLRNIIFQPIRSLSTSGSLCSFHSASTNGPTKSYNNYPLRPACYMYGPHRGNYIIPLGSYQVASCASGNAPTLDTSDPSHTQLPVTSAGLTEAGFLVIPYTGLTRTLHAHILITSCWLSKIESCWFGSADPKVVLVVGLFFTCTVTSQARVQLTK